MDETPEATQRLIDDELRILEHEDPRPNHRLHELRTRRNTYAHVSKLPAETFGEIFLLVRSSVTWTLAEWHHLAHVCRHWRQVALATPILWTNIKDCALEYTELMLERSKQASLNILLGLTPTPLSTITTIFKHSSRFKALYMIGDAEVQYVLQTVHTGEHNFTRMENLTISGGIVGMTVTDGNSYSTVPGVFFAHPSVLRNLSLSIGRMQVNWAHLSLPNLTSLNLRSMQLTQPISGDTLLSTLKGMPKLQTLRLDLPSLFPPAGQATHFSVTIPLLHLETCSLSGSHSSTPSLLSHMIMPQLHKLQISKFSHINPGYHLAFSAAISSALSNGAFGPCHSIVIQTRRVIISQRFPVHTTINFELSGISLPTQLITSVMQLLLSHLRKLGNDQIIIHEAFFKLHLLPADFILLLGELPALKRLQINASSSLESLAAVLSAYSEDTIPPLQHLSSIILHSISFHATGDSALSRLSDALVKRYSTGHGIKLLRLNRCTALSEHIRAKLQGINLSIEEDNIYAPQQLP